MGARDAQRTARPTVDPASSTYQLPTLSALPSAALYALHRWL